MKAHNKPVTIKNNKQTNLRVKKKIKLLHIQITRWGEEMGKIQFFCPSITKTGFLGAEAAKYALMLSLQHWMNRAPKNFHPCSLYLQSKNFRKLKQKT